VDQLEEARDPAGDTCTEVQARIPLFIGEDLDAPAMSRVEEHLATCAVCGGRASEARRARAALRRLAGDSREKSRDLWNGVRGLLRQEGLLAGAEHDVGCEAEVALQRPRPAQPLEIPEIHPKLDPTPAPDGPPSSPSQPLPPIVTRERPAAEQARRDMTEALPLADEPLLAPGEGAPDRLSIDVPVIEEKVYRAELDAPPAGL
jgi:hypothetical protein